jgi:hypothetical protein
MKKDYTDNLFNFLVIWALHFLVFISIIYLKHKFMRTNKRDITITKGNELMVELSAFLEVPYEPINMYNHDIFERKNKEDDNETTDRC